MPGQFRKTRVLGAVVIAISLVSNSIGAASAQALVASRTTPTFTATGDLADVIRVEHRWDGPRSRDGRRYDREDRKRWDRRAERRAERRRAERREERRDDRRYRNGHRGYRDYRPGYRQDNDGWWFPLAAFALGAVILNQQNRSQAPRQSYTPSYGSWNHIPSGNVAAHDAWCDQRYRSYDRATKTFQPYNGPRRYCNSPYDRL